MLRSEQSQGSLLTRHGNATVLRNLAGLPFGRKVPYKKTQIRTRFLSLNSIIYRFSLRFLNMISREESFQQTPIENAAGFRRPRRSGLWATTAQGFLYGRRLCSPSRECGHIHFRDYLYQLKICKRLLEPSIYLPSNATFTHKITLSFP